MGRRDVYEEKLRSWNHHHDPTINPGLGSPRCPRCLSLLNPDSGKGEWTITSVLHDATAVAGSGIGAMLSAVHGFNTGLTMVMVGHVDGKECTDWREDSGLCWEHYVCNVQCRALYRTGWGECLPHPQAERCLCRYQC